MSTFVGGPFGGTRQAKSFCALLALALLCQWRIEGATFTVSNVEDGGGGSLRQAIADANATPGRDLIVFSIGSGPQTLFPTTALVVQDPVVIDATTQPGFQGVPLIEISGVMAPAGYVGFDLLAPNCVIKGFVINAFEEGIQVRPPSSGNVIQGNFIGTDRLGRNAFGNRGSGIWIINSGGNMIGGVEKTNQNVISGNRYGVQISGPQSISNVVVGNYIGTDVSGTNDVGNSDIGLLLNPRLQNESGASRTRVGGTAPGERNIISGNNQFGIQIFLGTDNVIEGNYIGTDATGTRDLGNSFVGVIIADGANNTIGGTNVGSVNVISGNDRDGIVIFGQPAVGNLVLGNLIGTDSTGTRALGNGNGVNLTSSSSGGFTASNNRIGGPSPAERNVISGNFGRGIQVFGDSGAIGNFIQGNFIGTDISGNLPLGNATHGIILTNASDTVIGGTNAGAANVISGNSLSGIKITGAAASNNLIQGNIIGAGTWGTNTVSNRVHGILVDKFASGNLIGGTEDGAGNTIAFNGGNGVLVESGVGNAIRRNSIFLNAALGTDLGNDGFSVNDDLDNDSGANNLQNSPEILSQLNVGNTTIVQGTLNSTPGRTFFIEFYSNPTAHRAQGKTYLGQAIVSTDTQGHAIFSRALSDLNDPSSPAVRPGEFVTATATDLIGNNTSEFSPCNCLAVWCFSVVAGVAANTASHYGGFGAIGTLISNQIATVNQRFNDNNAGVFDGLFEFVVTSVYQFGGNPVAELSVPHPGYDFKVVYDGFPTQGGGWYAPYTTIHHSWAVTNDGGPFAGNATDGLVHEFGHSRGGVDLYGLEVAAANNPINGAAFSAVTSVMNSPYGVRVWDEYTKHLINKTRCNVVLPTNYLTDEFPASIRIKVSDLYGTAVSNAQVRLYPVPWFQNSVTNTPLVTGLTDAAGEFLLPSNPFGPNTPNTPWNIQYPNFLIEARHTSATNYEWMPMYDVQNFHFNFPAGAFVLPLALNVGTFQSWRDSQFTPAELANSAISGASADPDLDGISNLMEYALGLDPHSADPGSVVTYSQENGFFVASYTRRKESMAPDLGYMNQVASSLSGAWGSAPVVEVLDLGIMEQVKFRAQTPTTESGMEFFRLTVLHTP